MAPVEIINLVSSNLITRPKPTLNWSYQQVLFHTAPVLSKNNKKQFSEPHRCAHYHNMHSVVYTHLPAVVNTLVANQTSSQNRTNNCTIYSYVCVLKTSVPSFLSIGRSLPSGFSVRKLDFAARLGLVKKKGSNAFLPDNPEGTPPHMHCVQKLFCLLKKIKVNIFDPFCLELSATDGVRVSEQTHCWFQSLYGICWQ